MSALVPGTTSAAASAAEYFFAVKGKTRVFVYVNGKLVCMQLHCLRARMSKMSRLYYSIC